MRDERQAQRGKETLATVVKLLQEGHTPSEAAAQVRVTPAHVRRLVRQVRARDPRALPEAYRLPRDKKNKTNEEIQHQLKENAMDDRDREILNSRLEAQKERFDRVLFELKTDVDRQLKSLADQFQEVPATLLEKVKSVSARADKIPDDLCSRWPEICANWSKVKDLLAMHDEPEKQEELITHSSFQEYLDCPECGQEVKEQARQWARQNIGEVFGEDFLSDILRQRGFTVVKQAPQQRRNLI